MMDKADAQQTEPEVVLTPEMVQAGIDAYWAWEQSESYRVEDLVETLYRKLRALEIQSQTARPSGTSTP